MSYFEYLKYNVYSTYKEKILLNKDNNNCYLYQFKKPVYLVKLDIPDILIGCTLMLNGKSTAEFDINEQKIELLKKTDYYFEDLDSICIFTPINKKETLTNLYFINIIYTLTNIRMVSTFSGSSTMNVIKYIESIHILTNIINSDTNLEPVYINQKDNLTVYKLKLDKFKFINNLFLSIRTYLEKYNLNKLQFYVIYNFKKYSESENKCYYN
jgi:hypothetical protein